MGFSGSQPLSIRLEAGSREEARLASKALMENHVNVHRAFEFIEVLMNERDGMPFVRYLCHYALNHTTLEATPPQLAAEQRAAVEAKILKESKESFARQMVYAIVRYADGLKRGEREALRHQLRKVRWRDVSLGGPGVAGGVSIPFMKEGTERIKAGPNTNLWQRLERVKRRDASLGGPGVDARAVSSVLDARQGTRKPVDARRGPGGSAQVSAAPPLQTHSTMYKTRGNGDVNTKQCPHVHSRNIRDHFYCWANRRRVMVLEDVERALRSAAKEDADFRRCLDVAPRTEDGDDPTPAAAGEEELYASYVAFWMRWQQTEVEAVIREARGRAAFWLDVDEEALEHFTDQEVKGACARALRPSTRSSVYGSYLDRRP